MFQQFNISVLFIVIYIYVFVCFNTIITIAKHTQNKKHTHTHAFILSKCKKQKQMLKFNNSSPPTTNHATIQTFKIQSFKSQALKSNKQTSLFRSNKKDFNKNTSQLQFSHNQSSIFQTSLLFINIRHIISVIKTSQIQKFKFHLCVVPTFKINLNQNHTLNNSKFKQRQPHQKTKQNTCQLSKFQNSQM